MGGKAVKDRCSRKDVDLGKWSLEHAGDTAMVERMLRFLLNRSSGCLLSLCIVGLQNDTLFSLVAETQTLEAIGKSCPLEGLCRRVLPNNLFDEISQDEEIVAIAATMHRLRLLRINYLKFQNESILKILSSCPHLRHLDLRGCWKVDLVNHIHEYPSLTVLGPHIVEVRDFNEFTRAQDFESEVDPYLYTWDSDEYEEDESGLDDEEDEDERGLEDLEFDDTGFAILLW
ncbi:hypothetical protein RJ641_028770 [Dillenia turbinata]|uniref:Uncharacterized protein n=1 Tax=Dillenia turbinata TaxID=194707 RepID=A0AAN8ZFP8_9MAGN